MRSTSSSTRKLGSRRRRSRERLSIVSNRASLPFSGPVAYKPTESTSPDRANAETILREIPGVQGVGEGRDALGDLAWIAYVRDRSVQAKLPAAISGRTVVPQVSGEIDILPAE